MRLTMRISQCRRLRLVALTRISSPSRSLLISARVTATAQPASPDGRHAQSSTRYLERAVDTTKIPGLVALVIGRERRRLSRQRSGRRRCRSKRDDDHRHDLQPRVDDQAGRRRRDHDARRGWPAGARRSDLVVCARVHRPSRSSSTIDRVRRIVRRRDPRRARSPSVISSRTHPAWPMALPATRSFG